MKSILLAKLNRFEEAIDAILSYSTFKEAEEFCKEHIESRWQKYVLTLLLQKLQLCKDNDVDLVAYMLRNKTMLELSKVITPFLIMNHLNFYSHLNLSQVTFQYKSWSPF